MSAADLRFNAPCSGARAAGLVRAVLSGEPDAVVDLGCGRGELLLAVVAADSHVRGVGVDVDDVALAAARRAADERGVAPRVTFGSGDAAAYADHGDVAMCVGASHAFGGLAPLLAALRSPRAVVGDAFWAGPPDDWCVETFGALPDGVEGVRDVATAAGWIVAELTTSTIDEWDAFETTWRRGVDPELARRREQEYETHYRGVLGFAWLVLDR